MGYSFNMNIIDIINEESEVIDEQKEKMPTEKKLSKPFSNMENLKRYLRNERNQRFV